MSNHLHHPTQLWISDPHTLHDQMIAHLQRKLCAHQACTQCITCKQIIEKQHPSVIWLIPERSYTLEQIDELIQMASFKLDSNEQRFFIIQQAERLTDQCSNRLLKTIEEPFQGYNFFFLTQRPQALPLTIQSRCVVQKFKSESTFDTHQDFLQPFLTLNFMEPINFIKQVEALDIKEQETKELTDNLYEYWTTLLKQEIHERSETLSVAQSIVKVLHQALHNPPMTGSAKIFWKNLYITAHYATKTQKSKK